MGTGVGQHSSQVSLAMVAAGKRLGFLADRLAYLRDLGLLHDVGKSGDLAEAMKSFDGMDFKDMEEIDGMADYFRGLQAAHEEVGARILADAGMPQRMIDDVAHHGGINARSLDPATNPERGLLVYFDGLQSKIRSYNGIQAKSWAEAATDKFWRRGGDAFEDWLDNTGTREWVLSGGLDKVVPWIP